MTLQMLLRIAHTDTTRTTVGSLDTILLNRLANCNAMTVAVRRGLFPTA